MQLMRDGVDFIEIDRAMEAFGWPMGPAYLNDVIGMDTATRVFDSICAGLRQRLRRPAGGDAVEMLASSGRLGQKTAAGFYRYHVDAAGKTQRSDAPEVRQMLSSIELAAKRVIGREQIVGRMMLSIIAEAAWCLEDGIVDSPNELDLALVLGLGMPRYTGGALRYADWLGLDQVIALADEYSVHGGQYCLPPSLHDRAERGTRYYVR